MAGNDVKRIMFTINGKDLNFEVGKEIDGKLKRADKKNYGKLFETIANSDGNKQISEQEFELLKKLKVIFEKTGSNKGDTTWYILDKDDLALIEKLMKSPDLLSDNIKQEFNKFNAKHEQPKTEITKEMLDVSTETDKVPTEIDKESLKLKAPVIKEPTQAE